MIHEPGHTLTFQGVKSKACVHSHGFAWIRGPLHSSGLGRVRKLFSTSIELLLLHGSKPAGTLGYLALMLR